MTKNILVIAAHPDDEILGCGGTLIKYQKKGYRVKVIFISDGETSRRSTAKNIKMLILRRENQAIKVSELCKFLKPVFLRLPDNQLDRIALLDITKKIENEITQHQPHIIFTHSESDLNIDHRIVHQATMTACRPYKFKCVKSIYSFEIPSSTEANFTEKKKFFNPNYFFDVEKEIKKKIDALKVYKQELEKWPHPRSLKNVKLLANYRGSQSGLKYAEAFNLLRKIK